MSLSRLLTIKARVIIGRVQSSRSPVGGFERARRDQQEAAGEGGRVLEHAPQPPTRPRVPAGQRQCRGQKQGGGCARPQEARPGPAGPAAGAGRGQENQLGLEQHRQEAAEQRGRVAGRLGRAGAGQGL